MTLVSRLVFFAEKKTQKKSSSQIVTNEISVVIPVKDNQKGVNNYLEHFFASHPPDMFPKEIIVVDNNSKEPLKIAPHYHEKGVPVRLLHYAKTGPAAARNFGVSHATGEWILFNDSDCLPTQSLLKGYLEADNGSVAYAGNIKALGKNKLSSYYESQEILIPLKVPQTAREPIPQYLITANTLIYKEAFIEAGGFNDVIQIAGGEDIDLGLRLSLIGQLSYAFDSICLHDFNGGFIGFLKRFYRYGKGNRIVEKLWHANMKPRLFRPNKRSFFNEVAAKIQYVALLAGYINEYLHEKKRSKTLSCQLKRSIFADENQTVEYIRE